MEKNKGFFLFFILLFFIVLGQPLISANETIPFVNDASDLGQQFKEQWLPYILTFAVALAGTSVGNVIVKVIFEKSLKVLGFSKEKLENASSLITQGNLINDKLLQKIEVHFTKAIERMEYYEKELEITLAEISKLKEKMSQDNQNQINEMMDSNIKLKDTNKKIFNVLKIAFLNNPDLVRNGYATEISKVIESEEEKEK